MSVKLQKEHIKLSEVICERDCRTTAECDVIVPDIKPDILKVLRISSEAALTEKSIHNDRVNLCGIIRFNILYIPETKGIKSISVNHDFNHTIDIKGVHPDMKINAEIHCEPPEHTIVNSRKLNIRNKIGLNIKITADTELSIATGIDGEEPIRTKCEHIKLCNTNYEAERDIVIRQQLDVPSGKPDLCEILNFCAKPVSDELRLLDNKAIAKGDLCMSTLYSANDEECSVHCLEHHTPFTEILEVDGINENMAGEIDYFVKNVFYEITRDADGDKRIIDAEITLCACIRATETIECDAICDAYGLEHSITSDSAHYSIEQHIDTASVQLSDKERISAPDYLPEICQIFQCTAEPSIENITTEKGRATVTGYITCNILYTGNDADIPVSGFSHVIPFNHTFDISGINETSLCDAKATTEHLSYTISGPRDIEIRPITELCLKAVNPESREFISEINIDTEAPVPHVPSILIYFVQQGDTLWSIAKRYRTTPDAILENNSLDPDNLQIGSRICIFR